MNLNNGGRVHLPSGVMADYPLRLNHFLALANVASRREADELIMTGLVSINGKKAALGDKVLAHDVVTISSERNAENKLYIAYLKPKGAATLPGTAKELEMLVEKARLSPIADLDKNEEGIVLLTNDGRIARAVMMKHPLESFVLKLQEKVSETFTRKLESGVTVGNETFVAHKAKLLDERRFAVDIEADGGAIKAMCEALHKTVINLRRTAFCGISTNGMQSGEWQKLNAHEIKRLLASLGIS